MSVAVKFRSIYQVYKVKRLHSPQTIFPRATEQTDKFSALEFIAQNGYGHRFSITAIRT